MNVNIQLETITPERAAKILANSASNRDIRSSTVRDYARQMKAGLWQITHQGIAINHRGELVDGRHRLTGIVESGVTVQMFVARGFKADGHNALMVDTGAKRSFADVYGTDKKVANVCSFLARVATGTNGLSAAEVKPYYDAFCEDAAFILEGFKKNIRIITAAPVVAAATTARLIDLDAGGNGMYALRAYRRIRDMDSRDWTPAEAAFCRAVMNSDLNSADRDRLYSKSLQVFMRSSSSTSRLYASQTRTNRARNFLKSKVEGAS